MTSAKVYNFPTNNIQHTIQCKKLARGIAYKYGFVDNDIINDIMDHAVEMLPPKFSFNDWMEAVTEICEDILYCNELENE